MNKKLSEMDKDEIEIANKNVLKLMEKLQNIYSSCAERIMKTLILLNSGGVITVLAYVHNNYLAKGMTNLLISLTIFLLGLILITGLVAYDYWIVREMIGRLGKNFLKFSSNQLSYNKVNDIWSKAKSRFLMFLGAISFVCVILGIIFGIWGYIQSFNLM